MLIHVYKEVQVYDMVRSFHSCNVGIYIRPIKILGFTFLRTKTYSERSFDDPHVDGEYASRRTIQDTKKFLKDIAPLIYRDLKDENEDINIKI